ncbi:MAG TPA: GNAT family N-acetyltransferase [Caulobacteraceae bacterium]|nr:GNAT family N-acetyltransferase [Caulobacteraceae bacterium]
MKLETERLILRAWVAEDLEPFAAMSADPRVMRWLGGCLSREQVEAYMARAALSFSTLGMGRFAVERRSDGAFVGACGLMPGREDLPIAPYVDIGWRLTPTAWGQGCASEAAAVVLSDGFGRLGLEEIAAITMRTNRRSRAVMERLGMVRDAASDFDDPALTPHDDPRTVVYRVHRDPGRR